MSIHPQPIEITSWLTLFFFFFFKGNFFFQYFSYLIYFFSFLTMSKNVSQYFVHPWFACRVSKNPKILFSLYSVARTSRMTWRNPIKHPSTQSASFSKNDQNTSVTLGLTEGQTRSKATQNNTFHGFTSNSSFLEIFDNFDQVDPKLTLDKL